MPAGFARIEVRFLIDANGILNVTARDQRTGKETSVEVKPSYGLSDDQVEAMILESVEKAEEDFHERQVREARVEADTIQAATEKPARTTRTSRSATTSARRSSALLTSYLSFITATIIC
jgi:molecular chaperone DnaK (HSP70)